MKVISEMRLRFKLALSNLDYPPESGYASVNQLQAGKESGYSANRLHLDSSVTQALFLFLVYLAYPASFHIHGRQFFNSLKTLSPFLPS